MFLSSAHLGIIQKFSDTLEYPFVAGTLLEPWKFALYIETCHSGDYLKSHGVEEKEEEEKGGESLDS